MFRVRAARSFEGEIRVPGDKSISHRAIILAALSNGRSEIRNFLEGEDCRHTASVFKQLGVKIDHPEPGIVVVHGVSGKLQAPSEDLYCGNSGTTMRLMSGVLAGQPFACRLTGDPSLSRRPMKRVIDPLTGMGASLTAEGSRATPPLLIEGGPLSAIEYALPVASAQVKSAILLAGLFATGRTTVVEPVASRDHTERMFAYHMIDLNRVGNRVSVYGGQIPESRDFVVPGDISSAAFWLVAAAAMPGSRLLIRDVGLNPTRTGILDVLLRMGARIREVIDDFAHGEPRGVVDIKGAPLRGVTIGGAQIANVIDEIPILAVAAALATGETIISDAQELRVKETDRISAICQNLRAMGAAVEERDDGMKIIGRGGLRGARLQSFGDHRIAMAFAVAGLFATGETIIEDTECVHTSYPGFEETLRGLQSGGSLLQAISRPLSRFHAE